LLRLVTKELESHNTGISQDLNIMTITVLDGWADNVVDVSLHFGKTGDSFFKEEGFFCYLEYRSSKISLLVNIC